ncbi:MAG TPA: flavodoxin domain-containing protein [Pseudonocardiaceae bacterium]|jgi:menaquinone-dependent protoporphyrinogen oxidase
MTGMDGDRPGRRILVAYASKMGATKEIAEVIGDTLVAAGHQVTTRAAAEVMDLAPYDVVVLGSAIYLTRWRGEAVRFLRRHRAALSTRDVLLFHSGPCGDRDAARQLPLPSKVRRLADRIGAAPPITFGGRLDAATARGPLARWVARGDLAGDWRDWNQIRTWAAGVAEQLLPRA